MGTSKSYRGGPQWASQNTPRGKTHPSKGSESTAEGSHQSGEDEHGRKGMSKTARKKSRSMSISVKNPGPHGYS